MFYLNHFLFMLFTFQSICQAQPITPRPLKNVNLRCCVVVLEPYVRKNGLNESEFGILAFDGWTIDIFKKLQLHTGFTCDPFSQPEFENSVAVTYNSLVEHMTDCNDKPGFECKCDIGVGSWWASFDRVGVDFLSPHGLDSFIVLTTVDNMVLKNEILFFVRGFEPLVWILIILLSFCFIFIKYKDSRFASEYTPSTAPVQPGGIMWQNLRRIRLKGVRFYRLRKAVQSTLEKMSGHSRTEVIGEHRFRQWCLNLVIALFGLVLGLMYEATMTNKLVQSTFVSKFRSVEDLLDCEKMPFHETCYMEGDLSENYWISLMANRDKHCDNSSSNGGLKFISTLEAMANMTGEGRGCKYMMSNGGSAKHYISAMYCKELVVTGKPFFNYGLSFIVRKNLDEEQKDILERSSIILEESSSFVSLDNYLDSQFMCPQVDDVTISFPQLMLFFAVGFFTCSVLAIYMRVNPN